MFQLLAKSYQQQRRLSEVLSHVARVIILPNEEQISYWSIKQNPVACPDAQLM